jgi:hypothetical protein
MACFQMLELALKQQEQFTMTEKKRNLLLSELLEVGDKDTPENILPIKKPRQQTGFFSTVVTSDLNQSAPVPYQATP